MGDIAEMMLGGLLCEQCGDLIDGEWTGYPRLCECCQGDDIMNFDYEGEE